MYQILPKLFKFLLSVVLLELLLLTLLRIGFFIAFKNYGDDFTTAQLIQSFFIGFRFDIQLIVLINLPILLFGGIKKISIYELNFSKYFWIVYILITNLIMATVYVINFAYFDFFKKNVDSSIIRYFYDIGEAFKMVEQEYPIFSTALGVIVFCFILIVVFLKLYQNSLKTEEAQSKKKKIIASVIFVFIYIFAGYGKLELYPWRWSEAFFSSNNFLSYLASNPVTYFVNTLKNSDIKYDEKAVALYYDDIANLLDVEHKDPNTFSLVREINPAKESLNRPNVIFILGESTAYCRTSMSDNPLNPTPFLNSLAKEGVTYERYFTPHSGTARSVFTAMTGLVDVERMKTSSRNPMVVEQNMLLNSLEEYEKFYFIGGSLSWGNVRGVISNVDGITTREESSYDSPKNDVWGLSDADLLLEANKSLKELKKPFFAFIQLAGNHAPWTIPENSYGFEKAKNLSKDDLHKYSFDGKIEEYDGQKLMDHSVKIFIESARKEKYFDNTVFIFVGDHGLPKKSKHMHPSAEKFTLNSVHTPLIIYAPKLLEHRVVSYPVSEVDIMATVAGLSGLPYINSSFGRDILAEDFDEKDHYAFYIQHGSNPLLTLIGDKYVYTSRADGSDAKLYEYYYKDEAKNLVLENSEVATKMKNILLGLYESTRYTRFNNSTAKVNKLLKQQKEAK